MARFYQYKTETPTKRRLPLLLLPKHQIIFFKYIYIYIFFLSFRRSLLILCMLLLRFAHHPQPSILTALISLVYDTTSGGI